MNSYTDNVIFLIAAATALVFAAIKIHLDAKRRRIQNDMDAEYRKADYEKFMAYIQEKERREIERQRRVRRRRSPARPPTVSRYFLVRH